jgi:hypothetical protein
MNFGLNIVIVFVIYFVIFKILMEVINKFGIDFVGFFEDLWKKIKKAK